MSASFSIKLASWRLEQAVGCVPSCKYCVKWKVTLNSEQLKSAYIYKFSSALYMDANLGQGD